jgi:hypothetical protein
MTAGLGLTALMLAVFTLTGWFAYGRATIGALAAIGGIRAIRDIRRQQPAASPRERESSCARATRIAVVVSALLGCLGAIAPVTDDDALAYVVPIAHQIASTGTIHVWPNQARAMWPQSQQVLLAFLMNTGADRFGALTAFEWLLCVGVVSALARRTCERSEHIGAAMVIGLGAPVVGFLVSSAKEDLLLLAASVAAAYCLAGEGGIAELAAGGQFAGIAAGAKYPGALIAAAAIAWPIVHLRQRRLHGAVVVGLCAAASGGLWYALNLWRFGNPVAPFVWGAQGTPLTTDVIGAFIDGYGGGRSLAAFLNDPIRIFVETHLFGGRANLFNPLACAGLAGLLVAPARCRSAPLFFMAAVLYVGWFVNVQNARLLLPAAVFLAPAAADRLVPLARRWRAWQVTACVVAGLSLGIVAAVGAVRAVRYAANPAGYLERETQNYADVVWMNAHLDRRHDRVASDHKVLAYLDVPSLILEPTYQTEISGAELRDATSLLAACRRQGITHLFGNIDSFPELASHLRMIYRNPSSRLGGVRFFREPPTEATAVFEIVYDERVTQ